VTTDKAPTALVSWAHRNAGWQDAEAEAWQQTVQTFAELLRDNGVEAELDLWQPDPETDWTRWGQKMVRDCDFVVIALSEAWKQRWEGTNAPTVGVGAVWEADTLKGKFGNHQTEFQQQTLIALLPGVGNEVIPFDLYRLYRHSVQELTAAGIEPLLRVILDEPKYIKPPLGNGPTLPPAPSPLTRSAEALPPRRPLAPFEAMSRSEYLARATSVSQARATSRRRGTGLTEDQVARCIRYQPGVPQALTELRPGEIRVLHGPLGAGKSDIAEQWLRSNIAAAAGETDSAVPVWIDIDDLDRALEARVLEEVGLAALERVGVDLVVDGLDQRSAKAAGALRQSEEFVHKWPRSRLLLTSRSTEGLDERILLDAPPMSAGEASALMAAVAGRRVGPFGPQIDPALSRPLFALLVSQHATAAVGATGIPEVIDRVVSRVVSQEGYNLYAELRELAVATIRAGGPVDPVTFAPADVAERIRRSPLVSTADNKSSFALATFEQWFAARAIVEDQVDVVEVLTSLESFSRWRYVLAIVLAAAQPAQADPVMAALARWNPGAASWVVTETTSGGLTRIAPAMEDAEWESVGARLRTAFEAWLDGLGPLAAAFWPYRTWGLTSFEDISLAVEIFGRSLQVWWLKRGEYADEAPPLVLNPKAIGATLPRRNFKLVSVAVPTAVNGIWGVTRDHLAEDITPLFLDITRAVASTRPGVVSDEMRADEAGMRALQQVTPPFTGNLDFERLYPAADIAPSDEFPFGAYSGEMMHRCAVQVIEAAMTCYTELAGWVAPKFGRSLGLSGLMPVEFFGDMHYVSVGNGAKIFSSPGFAWLFRPLGVSSTGGSLGNRVTLTVNDDERDRLLRDDYALLYESFRRYAESNPVYEPFASSFSVHHGGINVLSRLPATRIALRWLWDDLKELKFINGNPPPNMF
jgi:hypothetical protein